MAQAMPAVTVTADVTVLVSRGAGSDLSVAARDVLARADAVEAVRTVAPTGFRPRATDIAVRLTATATVAVEPDADAAPTDAAAVADALCDGFGVQSATVTAMRAEQ
ncbi:hypothetical protein [Haloprofundus salinisoli]|uniref:hypothetical protein n=1 Tax=Haloprofundus salinisoli TaxID=2876193 RepID=UPI001CC96746|nr:hypothetical protein [Haloprofundus salinisoli]